MTVKTRTGAGRHAGPRWIASFVLSLLVPFLWTGAAAPVAAQNGPMQDSGITGDTTRINFDEAIRIALDQNTNLKRAANNVRRAEASVWAERMDWAPSANLRSSASRNFGRSFSQEEGQIINQSTDFFSIGVNSSITFQGMGIQNYASMRQAQSQSTASELTLGRTRQDVVFQVMNNYIALVENREILRVQREELEARRQQLRQIQEFVDAGSRPVSALYEQQAAVAEAESNVLTSERDVELTETRLLQVLRLDPMQPYSFQAPDLDRDTLVSADYDLQQLMANAFDRRLDLRSARASVNAAESGVRSARSRYYPTLSISGDYNTNWSSQAPDTQPIPGTGRVDTVNVLTQEGILLPRAIPLKLPDERQLGFYDILDQRRGGSIGISLSFPIFDGLRREQQIEEAQVSVQNARYDLEDQKLQIALEVREAYLNYRNAAKQLEVTAKQVRAARQAREAAQERYNLGAASIVELTNANRNFVQAASQRIRARYNFLFQEKLIDYYVGVLNPRESLFR